MDTHCSSPCSSWANYSCDGDCIAHKADIIYRPALQRERPCSYSLWEPTNSPLLGETLVLTDSRRGCVPGWSLEMGGPRISFPPSPWACCLHNGSTRDVRVARPPWLECFVQKAQWELHRNNQIHCLRGFEEDSWRVGGRSKKAWEGEAEAARHELGSTDGPHRALETRSGALLHCRLVWRLLPSKGRDCPPYP